MVYLSKLLVKENYIMGSTRWMLDVVGDLSLQNMAQTIHVTSAMGFVSQGSYTCMSKTSHSKHELNICHVCPEVP